MSSSHRNYLFWFLQLVLPASILLIPVTDLFTAQMRLFCIITLFAIVAFALETINQTCIAVLLPVAYMVSNVCAANVAFSPWTNFIPWMCISGLFLAAVLEKIGLLKRLSYKTVILTGGTYKGIIMSMGLLGFVLNLIMPGSVFIVLGAFAFGLCTSLELGKSRASAGIMFAAAVGSGVPTSFVLTTGQFIMYGIGGQINGLTTPSYSTYFLQQAPVGLLFYIIMLSVTYVIFKPEQPIAGKVFYQKAYADLGLMSTAEIKGIVISVLLVAAVMTEKWHGVAAGWCFVVIPFLMMLPGIKIADTRDFREVNFAIVIFIASCVSIGSAATAVGFGSLIGALSMPYLTGHGSTYVIIAIWLIGVIANFFMTPLSIYSAFAAPFTQIALSLNINPAVLYQALIYAGDQVLLPYENSFYLIIFSFGLLSMKDFAKGFGIKMLVNLLCLIFLFIPYWHLIDIL